MRTGMWILTVVAALTLSPAMGDTVAIGDPVPLGPRALAARMQRNPEMASFIALRGYPDWAEEVEVDSDLPLETHEVRLYYLRLDREVAFTQAYILGRPDIGLMLHEQVLSPEARARIEHAYLRRDPAARAERAAARAMSAADHAERAADAVEHMADRAESFASHMDRSFHESLRK